MAFVFVRRPFAGVLNTHKEQPACRKQCISLNQHLGTMKRRSAHPTLQATQRRTKRQRLILQAAQGTAEGTGSTSTGKGFTAMYERETPLVSILLDEIDREVEESEGKVSEEDRKEIVHTVVARHFPDMSQGLLMVLAGYAQAAYSKGQHQVAETLELIREEILRMSMDQMPVEMQVLDELVSMMDETKEARQKLLLAISEEAAASTEREEEEEGTPISLGSLRTTATQMLEDMESHDIVLDRRLLARLCLVREEIDEAATQLKESAAISSYHEMMTTSFRLLPMGNAAYVKEVLGVGLAEKRKALLEMCFKDDFKAEKDSQLLKKWRQQGVRPGRLMNTLKALLVALEEKGVGPDSPQRARLLEIQAMAVDILTSLIDKSD